MPPHRKLNLCRYGLDRAAQDAYALASYERAKAAMAAGVFKNEIVGVEVGGGRGYTMKQNTHTRHANHHNAKKNQRNRARAL